MISRSFPSLKPFPIFLLLLQISLNYAEAQDTIKQAMLIAVNEIRTSGCRCGGQQMPPVPALVWNTKLESAAKRHVKDMYKHNRMTHNGSDGSSVGTRVRSAGYSWMAVGENIAEGAESVEEVVSLWKESPGHCRNMMSPDYREMGAARLEQFWAQVFGRD